MGHLHNGGKRQIIEIMLQRTILNKMAAESPSNVI
jgi:hypothetical protein